MLMGEQIGIQSEITMFGIPKVGAGNHAGRITFTVAVLAGVSPANLKVLAADTAASTVKLIPMKILVIGSGGREHALVWN